MSTTILILGGGTGGIICAHELINKCDNDGTVNPARILLFEKEKENIFSPSLLWLMVGKRKPKQVYRNTAALSGNGVEVVLGKIEKINPEKISVTVDHKEHHGDYMVISLGTGYSEEHELSRYGCNFYTLQGAAAFHSNLEKFKGGKIVVLVSSLPFKCPAAPYEAAMLIESAIRKKGLRDKTEIILTTPEPQPMPVAGKALGESVKEMLRAKNIQYFSEHQLVSASNKTLTFNNGKTIKYDLLAYTPKHQCAEVICQSPLTGKSGWVEVNRSTMETQFPNVYAIGDNTFIPLESGKPLPKAGVFAHYQAEVVAHNIAQKIAGRNTFKTFNGDGFCFLEIGDGKAGFAGGNFYTSPAPAIKLKKPGYFLHWGKVLFEKYWWFKHF